MELYFSSWNTEMYKENEYISANPKIIILRYDNQIYCPNILTLLGTFWWEAG